MKHQHSKERPTTPALWSHDFKENQVSYKEEEDDSFGGSENDTGTDEDNTDQVTNESESVGIEDRIVFDDTPTEDDDDEEEEEEENESNEGDLSTEETLTNSRDGWAPPLAAPVIATGSEITLGGWGETSADVWHPQPKHHKPTAELPTPARSVVVSPISSPKAQQQSTPLQSTLQSPQTEWIGYREEKYQQQWQQSGLEVNAKKVTTKQRANVNHFRNTPQVSDSGEGWGVASNSYSWDSTPGYAKDVIEEQKSTLYWIKDSKQDWLPANPPPQTVETTTSTSRISKPRTANPSQPILFSEIASNMKRDASVGIPITPNHRSNNKGNHTRPEPVPPKRSDSPVSSDGSIPWSEVSNVNIKIRDDDFPPVSINSVSNNNNNKFSTPRKDTASRSKWHSAKEWETAKETNQTETATTISSQKVNSWQGNFSPKGKKKSIESSCWQCIHLSFCYRFIRYCYT